MLKNAFNTIVRFVYSKLFIQEIWKLMSKMCIKNLEKWINKYFAGSQFLSKVLKPLMQGIQLFVCMKDGDGQQVFSIM